MFDIVYNIYMTRLSLVLISLLSLLIVGCGAPFTAASDNVHDDAAPGDSGGVRPEAASADAPALDSGDAGTAFETGSPEGSSNPEGGADAPNTWDSPVCATSVSNVGSGDFSVHFTLTTTVGSISMALLSQRSGCDETSAWWDISYIPSSDQTHGAIAVSTCNGAASTYVVLDQAAGAHPDDGQPHDIVMSRIAGQLSFTIDGTLAGGPFADAYAFGSLPGLKIGSDDCPGFGQTVGSITDVCITTP